MASNSYKVLGQTNPTSANTESILYTVPNGFMAFASVLSICNQGATTSTVRVAVRPAGITSTAKTFILYDTYINPNDSLMMTLGLSLATTDIVSVWSSTTSFSFVLSGSEIVVDTTNVQSVYNIATSSSVGMMRPDNTSVGVNNGVLSLIPGGSFTQATSSNFGAVRPDNTSILITSGVISANIQTATSSVLGTVRPDNTSILITSGVISANIQTATSSVLGTVRPDNTSIVVNSGVLSAPTNAKVFCNWYYSGGIVINSSSNVSSVTYGGVGVYTINFIRAFANTNYVVICSMGDSLPAAPPSYPSYIQIGTKTNTSVTIYTGQPLSNIRTNFNSVDYPENNLVIFN
jgi:hypothetical protein